MQVSNPSRVGDALKTIIEHPVETFFRRWNWKSAALSACVRGSLFFAANLKAGRAAAVNAMLIEASFFIVAAGFSGAMLQTFRTVRPAWKATLLTAVAAPMFNHTVEISLHLSLGTKIIATSVAASMIFSAVSTSFNLFAMRRGLFIVGSEAASLPADLRRAPKILIEFLLTLLTFGGRLKKSDAH